MTKWKTLFGIQWLVVLLVTCTTKDQTNREVQTSKQPNYKAYTSNNRQCEQLVWHAYNTNRYAYFFDSTYRITQCYAVENGYSLNEYTFKQKMSYNKDGFLEEVQYEKGVSRYHYHNKQFSFIDFFHDGQPIYRYQIRLNSQGKIVALKGIPLQDNGLMAYSTQYKLDEQGRYVQLDAYTDKGVLYHRVIQQNFEQSITSPFVMIRQTFYDLNRHPWIMWGETFPISGELARHVVTYRYAAPETPTKLIKRSDMTVSWQTDSQGYITGQFSADALNMVRDTVRIEYINCR